ncbi:MAG: hypothetical protein JWR42_1769, partial [Marmoricola sp.]|nr:hypothetical protein [Marmoricola sp.]
AHRADGPVRVVRVEGVRHDAEV